MSDFLSLGLVFEAAWKSAVVAGIALAVLALFRRRSAAERACLAHFGMAAVLLVPILVWVGPRLELELLEAAPAIAAATEASGPSLLDLGFYLYLVPAALLLLITLVAIVRLFALRGRANIIVEQNWLTALAHAQRRMGIKSGTALLASQELRSPVSWGVLRPIILLSEETLQKPVDAEAIIAHELAHVARADWLNLLIARVTTALFWFNPLVWLLARQGNQLREEAADDAVLNADVPSTEYAALLVGAARHESRGLLLAANGVAPRKGSLSMRVHRILEPTLRRAPARFAWGGSCAAGAVLIAAPLAAMTLVAPPAPLAPPAPIALAGMPTVPGAPPAPLAPLPPSPRAGAPAAPLPPAAAPLAAPAVPAVPGSPVAPAAPGVPNAPAALPGQPAPMPPMAPIPLDALVKLRTAGFDSTTLQEYRSVYPALGDLDAGDFYSLRLHGVSPGQLRLYRALGYADLDVDQLVEWAALGVTPGYIQSLAHEGYVGLDPERLSQFRSLGVSADFIRDVKRAGLRMSPDRLVELRTRGAAPVDPPDPPQAPRPSRRRSS